MDMKTQGTANKHSILIGHLACFAAYTFFGINIVFCRDIATSGQVSPMDVFCFRATGATLLFWLTSLFFPREKVPFKDLVKIFFAAMIGMYVAQITFLHAMGHTTAFDASIIASTMPIMTMFIAAVVLKEPITLKKAGGVAISLAGVLLIIFNSQHNGGAARTEPVGVLLMLTNCLAFSLYLGIFRPLISRYHVITFMKWIFLFSMLMSVPFHLPSLLRLPYSEIETKVLWQIGYVVVFATFITYFLIPIGQKRLRPTLVSMYTYVQPIIAAAISIAWGMDHFTWQKLLAAFLVFEGVHLVNKSRAAGQPQR